MDAHPPSTHHVIQVSINCHLMNVERERDGGKEGGREGGRERERKNGDLISLSRILQ